MINLSTCGWHKSGEFVCGSCGALTQEQGMKSGITAFRNTINLITGGSEVRINQESKGYLAIALASFWRVISNMRCLKAKHSLLLHETFCYHLMEEIKQRLLLLFESLEV